MLYYIVGVVLEQLTFFRCGGVCLGVAVHHTVADGVAALHFINSWSKLTHTPTHLPIPPSLNRTHLRARSPPSITSPHIEYQIPNSSPNPKPFISSILNLSPHQLSLLKTLNPNLSTFKTLISHIWISSCKSRRLNPSTVTRLTITVDARSRLLPPLPPTYFGNAIFRSTAEAAAEEVVGFGGAGRIDGMMKWIDDEFVRSLVDCLEEKVDEVGVRKGGWVIPETDLWAISWLGLKIYDADFGWGKPVYMGRACLQFGGLVYVVPSSEEEGGGVKVVMSMEEENMGRFKEVFYEEIGCL